MNVSLNLPPEVEQALLHRAAAAGQDVETFLKAIVAERLSEDTEVATGKRSHEDFTVRLQKAIDLHPVGRGLADDSRESIYAGRGE